MILEDVQSQPDDSGIAIEQVGITDLKYPISVLDREQAKQDTIASIAMAVNVPAHLKGAHLSRFIEALEAHGGEITQQTLPHVLADIQRRLGSSSARMELSFPYFLRRKAPISRASALMDYECTVVGQRSGDVTSVTISVRVPVTSVCPCSRAISDYGAHNQRGYITVTVSPLQLQQGEFELIWFEELIKLAESSASSPVYPLLKRSDERYVTMNGYDNPVFVEDMVRNVARVLQRDERVGSYSVEAVNDESIHNHGAFARITGPSPAVSQSPG